jgi:hypothetical protein
MQIEKRGGTLALVCACCNFPYARVQFGRLVIQSKHYSKVHTNAITLEDLKKLVSMIDGDGRIEGGQERAPT